MKTLLAALLLALPFAPLASHAAQDARCFEMRVYYAAPGKLDALNARFRDHTCKLFEKHGMVNIGYWVPTDNASNKLAYVLAFPNRAARDQAWKNFSADPDWQAAAKASEKEGRLVTRVESTFLTATDFSPEIKPSKSDAPRLFELRTYKASPGKLENLLARFRDHTCKLFEKHGIANIAYWTADQGQKGKEETLVYIVAHKDAAAATASWKAFREDSNWLAARKASEEKAGGSLTADQGVKSEFLKPTDYSTIK